MSQIFQMASGMDEHGLMIHRNDSLYLDLFYFLHEVEPSDVMRWYSKSQGYQVSGSHMI